MVQAPKEGGIARIRNKPLRFRIVRGFLLAVVVAVATAVIPTPYYLEAPGKAMDVRDIITVEPPAKTYASKGSFILPTVVSEPANLLYLLYGLVDPEATLRKEPQEPQAQSPQRGPNQMELSQKLSALVAFRSLGYKLEPKLLGFRVLSVDENSPNRGLIQPGDLITEIDGDRLHTLNELRKRLDHLGADKSLPILLRRKDQNVKIQAKTFRPLDRAILGIIFRPEYEPFEFPYRLDFHSGNTSGASGGLVFALAIYDFFTPEDLTGGRIIAATGTLDARGVVGPIEGLDMKVKGALRAGAHVILVPRANYEKLESMPDAMQVIPVDSFNDALDILQHPK